MICTGNIARGKSAEQACEVVTMTEGNISARYRSKKQLLNLLPGYVKRITEGNLIRLNSDLIRIGKS